MTTRPDPPASRNPWRWLLPPPVRPGEHEHNRRSRTLHAILLIFLGLMTLYLAYILLVGIGPESSFLGFVLLLGMMVVTLWSLRWLHRGRIVAAGTLFTAAVWLVFTTANFANLRVNSSYLMGYVLVIFVAALMMNRRLVVVYGASSLLVVTLIYLAEASGLTNYPMESLNQGYVTFLVIFGSTALASYLFIVYLTETLTQLSQQQEKVNAVSRVLQRTGAEYHQTRSHLNMVLDSLPVTLFTLNREGLVTLVEGAQRVEALARLESALGQVIFRAFEEFAAGFQHHFDAILQGQEFTQVHAIEGSILELRLSPLHGVGGEIEGVLGIVLDVTQRAQVERERARSEQQFRAIFESALDVLLVIDGENGLIRAANPALHLSLGYQPQALEGQHFSALLPDDTQQSDDFLASIRAYGNVLEALPFRHQDGGVRQMELTASSVPWEDHTAILVILRDISERVALEEERRLIALKEKFISIVSHQFRLPLTVIQSSSDILRDYNHQLTTARRIQHFDRIRREIKRMVVMLEDVMLVRQSMMGMVDYHPQPLDLDALCREIIEEVQTLDYDNPERLQYRCGLDDCRVVLDDKLLRHILENLLTNAIKYTPGGGAIGLTIFLKGNELVFEVRDEGIGIPLENQQKLFDMFYRAENVPTGVAGTGLGLTIVRDFAALHGGSVSFVSKEGQGTTFTLRLPYQPVDSVDFHAAK